MLFQTVFQLPVLCLFVFGQYCSSFEICQWSAWTDLDGGNVRHRVRDCMENFKVESQTCKHTVYEIPNVTDHKRKSKLPFVIVYRCPHTSRAPSLLLSNEPETDLISKVPNEPIGTSELSNVTKESEITAGDSMTQLNQTQILALLKNIIIGALSVALIGVTTMLCIECKKRPSVIKRNCHYDEINELDFTSRQRTRSTTSSGYAIPKIRSVIQSGDPTYNRLTESNYINTSFIPDSQSRPLNDDKELEESCEMTQNLNPQTWKVIFDNLANGRQQKTGFMDSTSTSHSYIDVVEEREADLHSDSLKSSGSLKPNQDVMKQLNEILKKKPKIRGKVSR